jgi:hypothetical protein
MASSGFLISYQIGTQSDLQFYFFFKKGASPNAP